jgi:bifunctional non-homologous end joining protein LigD
MLLVSGMPDDPARGWVEPKLDGWRATVTSERGAVQVRTRTGRQIDVPELQPLAAALGDGTVIDGELIHGTGRMADFYPLAGTVASRARPRPLTFAAFDLVTCDGVSLVREPLEDRREALLARVQAGPHWAVVPQLPGTDLDLLLAECASAEMEGVVWKEAGSIYRPGMRSRSWRKVKTAAWAAHAPRRAPARRRRSTV